MKPKIALIYDRVNTPYGGAENVLLALHSMYPDAPVYTSVYNLDTAKWASKLTIIPSFLQIIPGIKNNHRFFAFLMPFAFESLDLSHYDIVISITSAEAKGVITKPNQLHISYVLTPPRYLYSHKEETLNSRKYLSIPGISYLVKKFLNYLTWWDQASILRPDTIIPISNLVAKRTKKYYGLKTAPVIYPPVSTQSVAQEKNLTIEAQLIPDDEYYLVVSRLVYYKRIDLAIKACTALGKKLLIVGDGPELSKLKSIASKSKEPTKISFLGSLSNSVVDALFKNAQAILTPGEEDFGITSLEANAYGKPVVLYYKSGAAEIITDKKHGIHLKKHSTESMIDALNLLDKTVFNQKELIKNAQKYDTNMFVQTFNATVTKYWALHQKVEMKDDYGN